MLPLASCLLPDAIAWHKCSCVLGSDPALFYGACLDCVLLAEVVWLEQQHCGLTAWKLGMLHRQLKHEPCSGKRDACVM